MEVAKHTKHIGYVRSGSMGASQVKESTVEKCIEEVKNALDDLKYGTITIVVQDGIPIQLDTTEKKRFK
jgi:hypothetical protein